MIPIFYFASHNFQQNKDSKTHKTVYKSSTQNTFLQFENFPYFANAQKRCFRICLIILVWNFVFVSGTSTYPIDVAW